MGRVHRRSLGIPPADKGALTRRSELKTKLREAHFQRDLGDPVRSDTVFRLRGVLSHRHRMIMLDVIVRTFISNPTIEVFFDESIRYHIQPKANLVLGVVRHDQTLRRFCMNCNNDWLVLLSPLCQNCLRPHVEHARAKCLFEATVWSEHTPDDEKFR